MSKAEDRAAKKALETFPILFGERMGYDKTNLQQERRNAYEKGYLQAEKDLELTWEDIPEILSICENLKTCWWFRDNEQTKQIGTQVFWEEVLKRFNKERRISNEHI